MSHKRKPYESLAFTVNITSPYKRNKVDNEEVVAVLAPFNPFPKVEFSAIKLNSSKAQNIILRNPNKNVIHVELSKLPESEHGFQWSDTQFELPGETETTLTVTWTPSDYGSSRHNIKIVNLKNKKVLSEIILISSTVDPPKNPRRCLRSCSNTAMKKPSGAVTKKTNTSVSKNVLENKENVHVIGSELRTITEERRRGSTVVQTSRQLKTTQQSSTVTKTRNSKVVKSTLKVKTEQQYFVEHSTPRRTTYEVLTPATTSRRSTYSLRNQTITNIIDVQREKLQFEAIASPGPHNDSLEQAALKLVEVEPLLTLEHGVRYTNDSDREGKTSFRRLSEEFDAFNFSSTSKTSSGSDHTGNLSPKVALSDVTFIAEKFKLDLTKTLNLNQFVSCSPISSQQLQSGTNDADKFSFKKVAKANSDGLYYGHFEKSFDSIDLAELKTKSFSESLNHIPLDLDKFELSTIITSSRNTSEVVGSLDHQFSDFSRHSIDSQQINMNDTFTKTVERCDSNNKMFDAIVSCSNLNSIKTKGKMEESSESSTSQSEIFSDSLERESSGTFVINHNPQTIVNQVSSAVTISSPSLLEAPSKDTTNTDQKPIIGDNSQTFVINHDPQTIDNQASFSESTGCTLTQQKSVIWDISPPKKEQENIVNQNLDRVPQIKRVLYTRNTTGTKKAFLGRVATKNILPTKTNINIGEIQPENDNYDSDNVFMVPTTKVKRSSSTLPKSFNTSPPKIRKMSQESKLKRLATPVNRKTTSTSSTQERKRPSVAVPGSLPRPSSLLKKRKSVKVTDWLPIRKLKLSSSSSHSQEDVTIESAVDYTAPDPFLAATSLNPFCQGSLFYDSKWLDNQEHELIAWTDRMLQPPSELQLDRDQSERGPLYRLNALRATAFSLLVSAESTAALTKVKVAVEKKIIAIRDDKQLHLDLGLQDKVVKLLMCYNPLWLRLCLEAIYQCNIHLKCHSDQAGLKNFIRARVVSDEFIKSKYSHPTIPYLWLPGFEDEMKKFTLYKFLVLVYLLDLVKTKKVMLHDPCLFNKDSKIKSSKEVLIEFNKDFISGSGDLTKTLRLKGYSVTHSQSYLHEFDFTLTNRSELRDGVRLTKLAEILTGNNTLCSKLRVPAIDNFQKEHNAKIALTALKSSGHSLPQDVMPKDISDGHKEKTLSLLWHLRGIIQKRSVHLIIVKWRETKELRQDRKHFLKVKRSVLKIQKWYRRMKRAKGLSDEDLKKGKEEREYFLKLKSAILFVQRKLRKKRKANELAKLSRAAGIIQIWYKRQKIMIKERNHFKTLRCAAVTVQKAYRRHIWHKLSSGLVERKQFLKQRNAAIKIQQKFKAYQLRKVDQLTFIKIKTATITIQKRFRSYYQAKTARQGFIEIKTATVVVQRRFKANQLAKKERESFLKQKAGALVLQRWFRTWRLRRLELKRATTVVMLQRRFRANRLAKASRQNFLKVKSACLFIQRTYRAKLLTKEIRNNYILKKTAVVLIQRKFRAIRLGRKDQQSYNSIRNATVFIQQKFRSNKIATREKIYLSKLKASTVLIQRMYRAKLLAKLQRASYLNLRSKTIFIQRYFRSNREIKIQREVYLKLRTTVIAVQRRYRANRETKLEHKSYLNFKSTVIYVQRKFRANRLAKLEHNSFMKLKSSALYLQKLFRANHLAKLQRSSYLKLKSTVIYVQRKFRANCLAKLEYESYIKLKSSAIYVQRKFRANCLAKLQRSSYLTLKSTVIYVQRKFRANRLAKLEYESYIKLKSSAIYVQRKYRANHLAKHQRSSYLKLKSTVIYVQRKFRENRLAKLEYESYIKLKSSAVYVQRKYRANHLAKLQRSSYLTLKSTVIYVQRKFRANRLAKLEYESYIKLKSSAVYVQRKYRANHLAKLQRSSYLKLKSTVISIQRKFRENRLARLEYESYIKLKSSAIYVQRKYRANHLAKLQRSSFLTLKSTVIYVQRKFRANRLAKLEYESYIKLKSSAVYVQRKYRANHLAKLQRSSYLKLKSTVIFIQRKFRANRLAKLEYESYIKLKSSAVYVQKKYRANHLAKLQRSSYLKLKSTAIFIQRKFRANCLAKLEYESYIKLKSTALHLQRQFRANYLAKLQHRSYLELKSSAIYVQRKFRANQEAKVIQQTYLKRKLSAIVIQRSFRSMMCRKKTKNDYHKLTLAAISVQRRFRAKYSAKLERAYFLKLISVTVFVQRRFRSIQETRINRQTFLKLKSTVIFVQRHFRAKLLSKKERDNFLRLKSSVLLIQRSFRMKCYTRRFGVVAPPAEPSLENKSKAAIILQAAWRGRVVRRRVVVPKPKIKPSDADCFRHTISNRGTRLLSMLHSFHKYSIAELLKILYNLDSITVLSSDQCDYFATHGAVRILFDIINGSYKAFGVDRGIELCLLIILNLYRSPKTADIVWKDTLEANGIPLLFELMMRFRLEKTSTVFCKAATVVWIFAKNPKNIEIILKAPNVLPMISYITKNMDKLKQPVPSTSKKVKSAATVKKLPALKPNWGNYFNDPRAFDDKIFAYTTVMDVLKLKK